MMPLVGLVSLLAGVSFIIIGWSVGWAAVSAGLVSLMLMAWYDDELKHLPEATNVRSIDDVISGDVLGQLPKNPSPYDVATAIGRVQSGQFFGVRFGISPRFLQEIASKDSNDMPAVWQEALTVREETNVPRLTGSVLAVALLRSFPNHEGLLAPLQLDDSDLLRGVRWQYELRELIVKSKQPRRTGGIARDLSFGYIPLLTRFGQNISEQMGRGSALSVDVSSHVNVLEQLVNTFGSGGRQNAVLVGATGVGKSTIIRAFAERLLDASSPLPDNLKFRQVFILDSAALIAAAPGRGELESLVIRVLNEAYSARNVIICLDNAQLFFEEGVGSVDITNVLLPILEAGRLRVLLTMDEQRYMQIGQRNSALVNALNRVVVEEVGKDETLRIMQNELIMTEYQRKVVYRYQALEEAYRLSERYIHDLAMPGRAIKLMESAAGYAENGLVTAHSVQQAIEQTMNIKVGVANDETERQKLLNLEDLIHQRMINQTRAVGVVSDALRRARAGVRNQDRPIGTFLFLGPTGVGKTELAKALADVYFQGEDRIIRIDMNEYVRPDDVMRLIADGANDPMSLTAQAMKQPFSVVLLDEIEKAHPQVLTTLLQLLDEGILRDERNREVSFRDAIVIATSNAGADRIREYIERGYQLEQFEKHFIDELINSNQFKPEFLNRFDEIVTFRPLSKEELVQVIDLMIAGINKTLSLQKISVDVEHAAKLYLVDHGYDPRLGARPMRRVVQRAVENTVAKQMLSGSVAPGTTIAITLDQVQQILGAQAEAQQIVDSTTTPSPQL